MKNKKVNDNKVDSTINKNNTINNNYNGNNKNYNKNNNEGEINNNGKISNKKKINNNSIKNYSDTNASQFTINNTNNENFLSHQLNKILSLHSTSKRKLIFNNNKLKKRFKSNKNNKVNIINSLIDQFKEPINYNDIFKLKDKIEWIKAIREELTNMEKLKVFDIIRKIPPNTNVISSR